MTGADPTLLPGFAEPDGGTSLGNRTPHTPNQAAFYETPEYFAGGAISPLANTKFSDAYARGWTGKGSLVTIADTGIDQDHPDLAANIQHVQDFTGTGIEDTNGHGTHVAGITAAVRDGRGIHGGAYDAKLAIAKVASSRSYSFDLARNATSWGRDLGAVAVNVSAAYLRDPSLESRLIQTGTGSYYIDHPEYGTSGFYGVKDTGQAWQQALGAKQVLVKAAGNSGTDYSAGLNQLATATDQDGRLLLNGQMLVVGNWDTSAERICGNAAGHVCTSWVDGACQDATSLADHFIMAPGTLVNSTYLEGGYASMTGTSMSAPLVAAAVAVLHQMWPHLDGRQLADILLTSANKSIAGYEEHVHGQGLLDMEAATRPIGQTGLPLTTTIEGLRAGVSGAARIAGVSKSAIAALRGVLVLDSYDRDFLVDLGDRFAAVDTRTVSAVAAGGLVNGYVGRFHPASHVAMQTQLSPHVTLTNGAGKEEGAFLGNRVSGLLGQVASSVTTYSLASLTRPIGSTRTSIVGQLGGGITLVDLADQPSLLAGVTPILSTTASLGAHRQMLGGTLGVMVSRPVQIESGAFHYRVPVARTSGNTIRFADRKLGLRPHRAGTDYGVFYGHDAFDGALRMDIFVEARDGVPVPAKGRHGTELRTSIAMRLRF